MTQGISLIVGLGNPGPEYAETRHNAGFRFLDAVLSGTRLRHESRFSGDVGRVTIAGREVWLLAPQTFMNHSGESVSAFAHYYKIPVEQILVAHDELDLQPGAVRLKIGGSGGGNGVADVCEKMGNPGFVRLRIGIGHPGSAAQVVSYVLKRAPANERELIDSAITRASQHLPEIVQGEFQKVMNAMHSS